MDTIYTSRQDKDVLINQHDSNEQINCCLIIRPTTVVDALQEKVLLVSRILSLTVSDLARGHNKKFLRDVIRNFFHYDRDMQVVHIALC